MRSAPTNYVKMTPQIIEAVSFNNPATKEVLLNLALQVAPIVDNVQKKGAYERILILLTQIFPEDKSNIISLFDTRRTASLSIRRGEPVKDASTLFSRSNPAAPAVIDADCPTCPGSTKKVPSAGHLNVARVSTPAEPKKEAVVVPAHLYEAEEQIEEKKDLGACETVEEVYEWFGYPEKNLKEIRPEMKSILSNVLKVDFPGNAKTEDLAKKIIEAHAAN